MISLVLSGFWGSPLWFFGCKVETLVTLHYTSWECTCVQCQVAVGQGKEESSGGSPQSLGIIASHMGAVGLLGGGM